MKTKLYAIFALLICAFAFSQEKTVIEIQVKQYSAKIDSIVTAEKAKMNKEMEEVDKNFSSGKITAQQQTEQKKQISEKYEKIINEKIEKEKDQLEVITKETVNVSIFGNKDLKIKNKGVVVNNDTIKKPRNPKYDLRGNDITVSYGFLNLTKDPGSLNPFEKESLMRVGNSHSFEVQFRRSRQLGKYTSPAFIHYGLAYRSDTYMPNKPLVFVQDNKQIYMQDFADGVIKRSKFRNNYITFPVDFSFVLNPKYKEFEGKSYLDMKKKQLRLGVGAYAGVKIRSIIKVKYYDGKGDFDKYQQLVDYGVEPFIFGAKVSLAYGGLNFFIKKDFTPVFNNQALIPNKNAIQVGVVFGNLNF